MASDGPAKISSEEIKKFQLILRLPAGVEKSKKISELSSTEQANFQSYVGFLKRQQEKKLLEQRQAELKAREAELLQTDRTYLVQAADKYTPKVGSVSHDAAVVVGNTSKLKH